MYLVVLVTHCLGHWLACSSSHHWTVVWKATVHTWYCLPCSYMWMSCVWTVSLTLSLYKTFVLQSRLDSWSLVCTHTTWKHPWNIHPIILGEDWYIWHPLGVGVHGTSFYYFCSNYHHLPVYGYWYVYISHCFCMPCLEYLLYRPSTCGNWTSSSSLGKCIVWFGGSLHLSTLKCRRRKSKLIMWSQLR